MPLTTVDVLTPAFTPRWQSASSAAGFDVMCKATTISALRTEFAVLRKELWRKDVWRNFATLLLQFVQQKSDLQSVAEEKLPRMEETGNTHSWQTSLPCGKHCVSCLEGPDLKPGYRLFWLLRGIVKSFEPYTGLVLYNRQRRFYLHH
jgi:hypothetical protein